ncbi:MAG: ribose-5-phosphate isomerase ribose 5-phosphate isomerase [Candidatus Taylorbacteria bacterium]|nr:ribose-5-phosphate isomerase ribose 5-phosphate isomerase [Candidatus Taylorbacteria bacterium]
MKNGKILIGTDHAGFELKNILVTYLKENGYNVEDMGAHTLDPEDDYPKLLIPVAMRVLEDPQNIKAIVFGGSGNGEAMICNRFPEVRAAVYYGGPIEIVKLSREHNDANVLSLGARFIDEKQMKNVVDLWLTTPFSGDKRHARRIALIDNIE